VQAVRVGQSRPKWTPNDSLFGAQAEETPAALAAALAPPAPMRRATTTNCAAASRRPRRPRRGGHARRGAVCAAHAALGPHLEGRFFEHLGRDGFGDLNRRTTNLQRQVRDNGITYNVYADAGGPQRPWSLDLFPLIVSPESWQQIEAGVLQRVRLLEGHPRRRLRPAEAAGRNLLPPALVQGHPGYLRAMHGVRRPAARRLHIAAFDLARDPDGAGGWCRSARRRPPAWATCWKTG
jgi:hypothetical protein